MVWPDLRDVLKAEIGLRLHVVAYLDHWTLVEDVGCLQLLLQPCPEAFVPSLSLQLRLCDRSLQQLRRLVIHFS